MKCQRCDVEIKDGDEAEHLGQILCEDCYIDALSPAKPCDPWAVHTAKSMSNDNSPLTERQKNILTVLKKTGGMPPESLAKRLGLSMNDLNRDLATLRHMEKVRAAMQDGEKILCLW